MQPYKFLIQFIIPFLIVLTFYSVCQAQWYDPDKVNKKAGEIYAIAYADAQEQKYEAAISKINQALAMEPRFLDAYLSRAGIYANLKKYDSSVIDYEKSFALDSVYSITYLLPYSISLAGKGEFQQALNAVTRFLQNPTLNSQSIRAGNYRKGV